MSDAVNKTDVCVVWGPSDGSGSFRDYTGVLQVTVSVGRDPGIAEQVAFQRFLHAVKRLQEVTRS